MTDSTFTLEATPEELLITAIRNELSTRTWILQMAERVPDADSREALTDLATRKVIHRQEFERKFRQETGSEPPFPDEDLVQLPVHIESLDLARALKAALERERDLESEWRFLAERVPDTPLHRLLLEMAEIQWRHRNEVQQLYDAAASTDPERFFLDM